MRAYHTLNGTFANCVSIKQLQMIPQLQSSTAIAFLPMLLSSCVFITITNGRLLS